MIAPIKGAQPLLEAENIETRRQRIQTLPVSENIEGPW